MNKPLIGITTSEFVVESGTLCGTKKTSLSNDYVQAVLKAGGLPILLPTISTKDIIESYITHIDGLILSGGGDIDPQYFDEEPYPNLGSVAPERDIFEITACKICSSQNKPILGICRGIQLINVAFGGTIYQDIYQQHKEPCLQHNQTSPKNSGWHNINIVDDTLLKNILATNTLRTNSFHHQAINQVAPDFIINSYTNDHIIEGIEKMDHRFILGLQWHPEMMLPHPVMSNIFREFINATINIANITS